MRFIDFFKRSIQTAGNLFKNARLEYGESVNIRFKLPAGKSTDSLSFFGFLAKGMAIVGFFGCRFELYDSSGELLFTEQDIIRFFVNEDGTPPAKPIEVDSDGGTATYKQHWLKSGGAYTLRVTQTKHGTVVPLRFYTTGFKEVENEPREVESLKDRVEILEAVVNRLATEAL